MSAPAAAFVTITSACADAAEADRIATALVEEHLAACVQTLPITSTYRWDGEVRRDAEVLLLAKTTAARAGEAQARIAALHSYDVPEIVVTPIVAGSDAYLGWVAAEVA